MSIRQGILALLAVEPMHGYQLRVEFESRTGATWPLNVGQIYSTLGRLERDGLVTPLETDSDGRVKYQITDDGRAALSGWFASPTDRTNPPRDELSIKLAMAATVPGVDVSAVVATQRSATLRALQDYTRLKADKPSAPTSAAELSWLLVLESLIFTADAEIRWLDHCEARLLQVAAIHRAGDTGDGRASAAAQAKPRATAATSTKAGR